MYHIFVHVIFRAFVAAHELRNNLLHKDVYVYSILKQLTLSWSMTSMICCLRNLLKRSMDACEARRMMATSDSSLGPMMYASCVDRSDRSKVATFRAARQVSMNSPGNLSLLNSPMILPCGINTIIGVVVAYILTLIHCFYSITRFPDISFLSVSLLITSFSLQFVI